MESKANALTAPDYRAQTKCIQLILTGYFSLGISQLSQQEAVVLDGYKHGPIQCRICFVGSEKTLSLDEWRLHNNPGYYGSTNPEILVLGFSKGANQNEAAKHGDFDKVAFAKARPRLKTVLETLGVMPFDRSIDALMTAREDKFGIASLVRCSFCKMKGAECKTSGDVVPTAFTTPSTLAVIRRCTEKYLSKLPARVRLVLLLGSSDTYISKTREIFSTLYSDFAPVNSAAFRAGGALWVFAAHPSPGNGHFDSWVSGGPENASGRKRLLALQALGNA